MKIIVIIIIIKTIIKEMIMVLTALKSKRKVTKARRRLQHSATAAWLDEALRELFD